MNSYYYIDDTTKQQCGPFPINELQTKGIKPTTIVWCTGMEDWAEAQAVTELSFLFGTNSSTSQGNDNIQLNPIQEIIKITTSKEETNRCMGQMFLEDKIQTTLMFVLCLKIG